MPGVEYDENGEPINLEEYYIVPGRVENPDSDYYGFLYTYDPEYKIYIYNDTLGNTCKLTANHDIRAGTILGWYVADNETCDYPYWTYSQAIQDGPNRFMTGPNGTVYTSVNVSTFTTNYYIEVNAPPLYFYDYTAYYYSYDSYWYDGGAQADTIENVDNGYSES